jgi:hypothetical protein
MDFVVTVKQEVNGAIVLRRIVVESVSPENAVAKAKELASFDFGRTGFDWSNAEHEPA